MTSVRVRGYAARRRCALGGVRRALPAGHFLPPHRLEGASSRRCFGHRTHYLVAERGGELAGVLPLAEVKSLLFGHALVSLPFCAVAGVAASDAEAIAAPSRCGAGARASASAPPISSCAIRAPRTCRLAAPGPLRELPQDPQARSRSKPARHPAQAARDGAQGNQARPRRRARRRRRALLPLSTPTTCTATARRRCPGATSKLCARPSVPTATCLPSSTARQTRSRACSRFYFRDEVLPYYAGDRAAARDLAANDFKYWELMRRACERGVRVFDFGRSKQGTGPFDFKKNWGFEPAPLAYEYCLYRRSSIPQNNPLEPEVPRVHRALESACRSRWRMRSARIW